VKAKEPQSKVLQRKMFTFVFLRATLQKHHRPHRDFYKNLLGDMEILAAVVYLARMFLEEKLWHSR